MSKNKALKIVNVVLAVLVINQIGSAFLFERGAISYTAFEWMHKRGVWVLIAAVVVHLILNWNWVKANYFRKR
jgi:hypothetical protein